MPRRPVGISPTAPSVRTVRGSKRTGTGISVSARNAMPEALDRHVGVGDPAPSTGSDVTPEKIARHGSVPNSEYFILPSRFHAS